ncbi:SDR family oxidoreductase [Halococcoides cellulosivorans]|uniref:Oxidoreductase n=1 Tax=Halococcoides cellulosivorans TaxID=1679096 RepID=A0A2R4WZ26_9EURY|nr:SDR family oxidoreductase [Halococcoides cellulosivorans]AWB26792.1 oxidoreductase [Halococcoides cellulosivorans]
MATVLITGASSGIGAATARRFLAAGWDVIATARDPDDCADLAERGAQTARLDVTEPRTIERTVDDIDTLDCVVNNAGVGQFGPVEDVPADALHDQFDVNVYGPHRVARAALPALAESNGRIVTVSSIAARFGAPGMGAYCASKAAIERLSDAMRAELRPHGVEVVLIQPGPVETEFADRADASRANLERSGRYNRVYQMQDDRRSLEYDSTFGVEPDRVASAITDAATVSDPPARVRVGPLATLSRLIEWLPARWQDRAFDLAVGGLDRIPGT